LQGVPGGVKRQELWIPQLPMVHLDYVSCLLTVLSTVLVGRRKWQGWMVAGANSAIICVIGLRTGQWGFLPANVFCIAIYAYNIRKWRTHKPERAESPSATLSVRLNQQAATPAEVTRSGKPRRVACRMSGKCAGDERLTCYRIRPRRVPNQREPRTPF
jgi:hypothetical protein